MAMSDYGKYALYIYDKRGDLEKILSCDSVKTVWKAMYSRMRQEMDFGGAMPSFDLLNAETGEVLAGGYAIETVDFQHCDRIAYQDFYLHEYRHQNAIVLATRIEY